MKTSTTILISGICLFYASACSGQAIPASVYNYLLRVNDSITSRNTHQKEISPLTIGHRMTELANIALQIYDSTACTTYQYGLTKSNCAVQVDTTLIAGRSSLQNYVKYSDTGALLQPYLHAADTTGKWQPRGSYAQSAAVGAANGICPLGANGTVPLNYFPSTVLGAVKYKGSWNAATGVASTGDTLRSSAGSTGDYFVVNAAGNTVINGNGNWHLKDWIVYNGTAWDKVDNTETVTAVNGNTGDVRIGLPGITAVSNTTTDAITASGFTAAYNNDYSRLSPHLSLYPGIELFSNGNFDDQISLNSNGAYNFLTNGGYADVTGGNITANGTLTVNGGNGIILTKGMMHILSDDKKCDAVNFMNKGGTGNINLYQKGINGIALAFVGNSAYNTEGNEYFLNNEGNIIAQLGTQPFTDDDGNTTESGALYLSDSDGNNNILMDGQWGNITANSYAAAIKIIEASPGIADAATHTIVYKGGSKGTIMMIDDGSCAIKSNQVVVIKNMGTDDIVIAGKSSYFTIDNAPQYTLHVGAVITLQRGPEGDDNFYIIGLAANLDR